ncbi:MAG: rod shape-determining protein [Clostridia bacterium]|nr:rod shape-determining protein [Clostridia bacterium]MBQ1555032.1 rod shape-determining protein [Clostridia bacterium]MBQ4397818.1 rod shape-determining protein [Clostridia bacterium]
MDVGIDLGSSSVKIFTPGREIALNEPTMVAVDRDTDEILAFGSDARHMLGRTSDRIAVVSPLQYGRIRHFRLTEIMLTAYVKEVCGSRIFMPRVVVCVPAGVSEVEKQEVVESLRAAGARKVCLIETVVAAALGAGLDISKPRGVMICDIGGDTTDIGVMSVNGTAASHWIKTAGQSFNQALTEHIRKEHGLIIGPRTAEILKKEAGGVIPREKSLTVTVKGRSAQTGMPAMISITSEEILEAFEEPAVRIYRAVQRTLEETPPALAGDLLSGNGITLTGGGARLYGMDKLIAEHTNLSVTVATDAPMCVALGTGKAIRFMDTRDPFEKETSPLDVFGY